MRASAARLRPNTLAGTYRTSEKLPDKANNSAARPFAARAPFSCRGLLALRRSPSQASPRWDAPSAAALHEAESFAASSASRPAGRPELRKTFPPRSWETLRQIGRAHV